MKKKYNLLFSTFATLLFLKLTKSDCDVCQVNGVACLSQNVYSLCLNGSPTEDYETCPENKLCMAGHLVCYSQDEIASNAIVSCNRPDVTPSPYSAAYSGCGFGLCDSNKVYACLNATTIGFCFGQSTPLLDPLTYSHCPEDTVCDLHSTQGFCTNIENFESRCPNYTDNDEDDYNGSSEVETTTAPSVDVNKICEKANSKGSFKPDNDPTCTKFVLCYDIGIGILQSCPAGQYFDATKKSCHADIPPECATTTTTTITTTTTVTTTTTAAPKFDPNKFCEDLHLTGIFRLDSDPTCTEYVVCYAMGTKILGLHKTCPVEQYFDATAEKCVTVLPAECTN